MGILSSSSSITRYKVAGRLEGSVNEMILRGLRQNIIQDTGDEGLATVMGWTSLENPYTPDFEGYSFVMGTYMVFSLRIDKKSLPPKLVKKHYALEAEKHLSKTGRRFLTANEKKAIKETVTNNLLLRIPAVPNVYDLIWNYEDAALWFFSNLKSANEELETLFIKSFGLQLIRLFPYTTADLLSGLSDSQRDLLSKLEPDHFQE